MVIVQLVDLAEDSQHALEGITLEIIPTNVVGKEAIAFGFVRTPKTRKAKVRVYFDTDKEGSDVFEEGIASVGIDGSGTGNRIFFLRELKSILSMANSLVIEVDDGQQDFAARPKRRLWRRMSLKFGGVKK